MTRSCTTCHHRAGTYAGRCVAWLNDTTVCGCPCEPWHAVQLLGRALRTSPGLDQRNAARA